MSASESTISRICRAAIRLASRDGLLSMTLDNVAREAGMSKGGVMYHFPTKDLLVAGVLKYFGDQTERLLLERMALDPDPRRRWARTMLQTLFPRPEESRPVTSEGATATTEEEFDPRLMHKFFLALLAAALHSPQVMEPIRQLGVRMRSLVLTDREDGLNQLLIWLAVDGLMLWQYFGLIDRSDPLFDQIGQALHTLAQPEQAGTPLTRGDRSLDASPRAGDPGPDAGQSHD